MNGSLTAENRIPDFLRARVREGTLDAMTARRIELLRLTRGSHRSFESSFQPLFITGHVSADMTFESFLVSLNNLLAVETVKELLDKTAWHEKGLLLYIYADSGAGKTHLLQAIANAVLSREALVISVADLVKEYERVTEINAKSELRTWLASFDMLLLDDIEVLENLTDLQMELVSALAQTLKDRRHVVVTSKAPPNFLTNMETTLTGLLASGDVMGMGVCDSQDVAAELRRTLGEEPLPPGIIDFLSDQFPTEWKRLKAVALRLLEVQKSSAAVLTTEIARQVLLQTSHSISQRMGDDNACLSEGNGSCPITHSTGSEQAAPFKQMVAAALTEAEQLVALQFACAARIGQLRTEGGDPDNIKRLEQALETLRAGNIAAAVRFIGGGGLP